MSAEIPMQRSYIPKESDEYYREAAERMKSPYPIIGILGGMGPDATGDLYNTINRVTKEYKTVEGDKDFLPIRVVDDPYIPDRTKYILWTLGIEQPATPPDDPFPHLRRDSLELITGNKAEIIGVPCNTAHFFLPALTEAMKREGHQVEFIHMINEVKKEIKLQNPNLKKIGLLATTGTIQTELYKYILEQDKNHGLEVIMPDDNMQLEVTDGIYGNISGEGVKGGFIEGPRKKFESAGVHLIDKGAEVIIGGCTEIPLAVNQDNFSVSFINPTEVLARALVKRSIAGRR